MDLKSGVVGADLNHLIVFLVLFLPVVIPVLVVTPVLVDPLIALEPLGDGTGILLPLGLVHHPSQAQDQEPVYEE
jgi:hypothetical protein